MNRLISTTAFLAGLAVVIWVGVGYVGSSPLGLATTALIAAAYLAGAAELWRFHHATGALETALAAVPEHAAHPGEWLSTLPPALRNPVRLRLDGERAGLPGPALTPYLVGLLVLLGMLGTFLGMVVTLNGAVIALEGTTSLQAIRAALAAPVKGLGVAFGTSVAGVAASAMLGLISALCRRARLQASQHLDGKLATSLRPYSLAHRRDETFAALQTQSQALPELVATLKAAMAQMEQHSHEQGQRLAAEQERFHREAGATYAALAQSVGASLRESLTESARLAGETIAPAVSTAMQGIARETAALQSRIAAAVEAQLDGIATRFDTSVGQVSETWMRAVSSQQHANQALERQWQDNLTRYADTFGQRSAQLLASVETAHAALRTELAATTQGIAEQTGTLHANLSATLEKRLDAVANRLDASVEAVAQNWTRALATHTAASQALSDDLRRALDAVATSLAERSAALLRSIADTGTALHAELATRDEARQSALATSLEAMAATLRQEWQRSGAQALAQQEEIVRTLGNTARDVAAAAQAQARGTIAEVARLMDTAAEAPRAAAAVIGELRRELSASIARDNELLAERSRIMETLGALLDAINHASTEQRTAIDALVTASATMLDRAGARFGEHIDAEAARLADAAAGVSGGAAEVASLGEAFGLAVQRFADSNDQLMATLARIEGALDKSLSRSDDQLAYYVAQAREIIDLSILSQRQVVEELQGAAGRQPALAGEV